jgi:putative transposase
VNAHQAIYSVAMQCRVLDLTRSGYYAWEAHPVSDRTRADEELTRKIRTIHAASHGTYGAPRIHAELVAQGVHVGKKRIARLMAAGGIHGVSRRRVFHTTKRNPKATPAPDLVKRDFTADAPDRLWVADITYIPTREGFLYLATVLDVFSRKIVGWAMDTVLLARIVLAALEMAVARRQPTDVTHHSDHGCQYTSIAFGKRCKAHRIRISMGSVGDAFDNAMAEAFFASLECELLDRTTFHTRAEGRTAVFNYIERWYNPCRRHSALGYLSPVEFERARDAIHGKRSHRVA